MLEGYRPWRHIVQGLLHCCLTIGNLTISSADGTVSSTIAKHGTFANVELG